MPSSPKISKQLMIETAFEILSQDGYSMLNIKAVANKIGCSTQPISRHFGSMDGLRRELLDYSIERLHSFFRLEGECVQDIIEGIANGYITLAFDHPNLYKYFYMSESDGERMQIVTQSLRSINYNKILEMFATEYNMSASSANNFIENMSFYVHGIASYVAVGYVSLTKEEVMKRIHKTMQTLLLETTDCTN